uniref:Uncharacterized protein n=1 Tax=Noccaea caerulescens TaxID=107243 RepID=A0A1J3JF60_NOCCA
MSDTLCLVFQLLGFKNQVDYHSLPLSLSRRPFLLLSFFLISNLVSASPCLPDTLGYLGEVTIRVYGDMYQPKEYYQSAGIKLKRDGVIYIEINMRDF